MSMRGMTIPVGTTTPLAEILDQGYDFVLTHLGSGAEGYLTASRANAYIASGLTIVSVFDGAEQRAAGGPVGYDPRLFEDSDKVLRDAARLGGVADGTRAHLLARAVGQAPGSAIYFEIDADVSAGMPYVLEYFRGIAEGLAQAAGGQAGYSIGVYGSGLVIDAVHDAGLAEFRWLAEPAQWQGSAEYPDQDILRSAPGGLAAAPEADFGQWGTSSAIPNLVINDLSLGTTLLPAEGATTIAFAIGNAGTAVSSASTATLYLSEDDTVGAGDTVLGVFHVPALVEGGSISGSMAWTLPADLAPGSYHIAIAADAIPGEASATDNAYAIPFTVTASLAGSPNMVINQLSLGATAVPAGGLQTISFEVGNAGAGATGATTASLYLSADETITTADILLGAFPVPALAPGGASGRTLSATIPAGTAEGTYYIGVVAGPIAGETSVFDNTYATSFTITVASNARPNLVIDHLTLATPSVVAGGETVIDFAVGNAGTGAASASSATVYLSVDETITAQDTVLGRFTLPALKPGSSSAAQLQATIPSGIPAGTYHIGVVAEPVPGEPNIFDNNFAAPITVLRSAGAVSIGDVTVAEGDDGTTMATFVVMRRAGTEPFDVAYATSDGGATVADNDYVPASGTLAFAENEVMRTISIAVNGDATDESALLQTFFVTLSDGTNGVSIARARGQGTIIDDDNLSTHNVVHSTPEDEYFDLGAGIDTVVFSQPRDQYQVGVRDSVVRVSGPDGHDELRNVEVLRFGEFATITVDTLRGQATTDELYLNLIADGLKYHLPMRHAGPNGLDYTLLATNGDDVLQGTSRNDFANLGAGNDAASMGAGDDVVDGGGGSNFLTGGTGRDTFFVDGRDLLSVWSCITDWEPGEALTLWGWRDGVSQAAWSESDGLPGYLGATMFADIDGDGKVETAVTWTGVALADLPAGKAFDVSGIGVLYIC